MKHTCIFDKGTELLLLAYSSETAWLPLEIGNLVVDVDGDYFVVIKKVYYIKEDKMVYWVKSEEINEI